MPALIGYTEQPVYESQIRHYCTVELTDDAVQLTYLTRGPLKSTLPPDEIRAALKHMEEHGSLPPGVKTRVQEIALSKIKGVRVTDFSQLVFDQTPGGGLMGGLKRALTSKGVQFETSERASFEAFADQVRARIKQE